MTLRSHRQAERQERDSEGSDDALDELDDDDFDLQGYREQRLEALKRDMDKAQAMREGNHGRLTEFKDEKQLIETTAKEKLAVVHFFHRDFRRCAIMDKHLETLAAKHFSTLFIKADVANVPFLVEKLEIRVLPCVICFVDGTTKERIIGFEGLSESSNVDTFTTAALEMRMQSCGVLSGSLLAKPKVSAFGFRDKAAVDGDESD